MNEIHFTIINNFVESRNNLMATGYCDFENVCEKIKSLTFKEHRNYSDLKFVLYNLC